MAPKKSWFRTLFSPENIIAYICVAVIIAVKSTDETARFIAFALLGFLAFCVFCLVGWYLFMVTLHAMVATTSAAWHRGKVQQEIEKEHYMRDALP